MIRRTAVVVGGGIGGLAAATGLQAAGWRVMVLERLARFDEVGAGVALTANGLAAAGVIGVRSALIEAGRRTRLMGYRDQHDEWIFRLPHSDVSAMVGIHRQRLHEVLLDAARHCDLRPGCRVTSIEPGEPAGPRARVRYVREGQEHRVEADLVVGADGLRSTVRSNVFPDVPVRYCGCTCWRGVADLPDEVADHRFVAWWGPGTEFGILPIGPGRFYWYGYVQSPSGLRAPDEKDAALRYFADWPDEIQRPIQATDAVAVLRHDVFRLATPLRRYTRGRVALIGDAAHAMVPTIGQGANSALEDAVSLAPQLTDDLALGLRRFSKARWLRTQRMWVQANGMHAFGAGLGSPAANWLRNKAFRLTPAPLLERQGAWLLRWTPPI